MNTKTEIIATVVARRSTLGARVLKGETVRVVIRQNISGKWLVRAINNRGETVGKLLHPLSKRVAQDRAWDYARTF